MKRIWPFVLTAGVAIVAVTVLLPPPVRMLADYDPAFIKPRIDWREVLAYRPAEQGNAAEQYVAIARQYYPPGRGVRWPEGEVLPPLLELAKEGARRKECTFGTEVFVLLLNGKEQRLLPVTGYDDELGHLSPFRNVGHALRAEGEKLYAQGEVEKAVRAYESAVILGARLVEGRESSLQVLVGLAIQTGYETRNKRELERAMLSLHRSEGDDGKYQRWIEYYASLDEFQQEFGDKLRRVEAAREADLTGRPSEDKTAKPEDIEFALAVALHDEDPMMKREAILALGTLKEPSRRVKAVLRRIERKDAGPYVREAARNALRRLEAPS